MPQHPLDLASFIAAINRLCRSQFSSCALDSAAVAIVRWNLSTVMWLGSTILKSSALRATVDFRSSIGAGRRSAMAV